MTRGFSPLKAKNRIDDLIKSECEFYLSAESKKLNTKPKSFLALLKRRKENFVISRKYMRGDGIVPGRKVSTYQFQKEIL